MAVDHFQFAVIEEFAVRLSRRPPGRPGVEVEFDTLVVGPDAVILGEAKSTPTLQYVDAFAAKVETFFDYFPEYSGRRLIPVMGSWAMSDAVVDALTVRRIYAMRMGEETMELANAAAIEAGRED